MAYKACSTSCTIELLRKGDKAINSLIAATTIQNWAVDKNSRVMGRGAVVS